MSVVGRRLIWAGAILAGSQILFYVGCSRIGERIVPIPDSFTPTHYVSLYVGGNYVCPSGLLPIEQSLRPGDVVHITSREVPMILSSDTLMVVTYRIAGPGGYRFHACTPRGAMIVRAAAGMLLPLLICLLIGIELEARRK